MTDAHHDRADENGSKGASSSRTARQRFLFMLSKTGNASKACQTSGLTRRQVMTLRDGDPAFGQAYDDAMNEAADLLEAEAWRRALEGTTQPVLKGGRPVVNPATGEMVVVRRYSDPLLMLLLRGCRPEKFQMHGRMSMPADPMIGIREIAIDNDPPRAEVEDEPS